MKFFILLILAGATLLFMVVRHHAVSRGFDRAANEAGAVECFCFCFTTFLCVAGAALVE